MSTTIDRADALWRALTYASVAQLHLRDNVLLSRPLNRGDVKEHPSGHWGTVPGTAWALAHIGLLASRYPEDMRVVPLLGAGHAGVVQLSLAWLSGALCRVRPRFTADIAGLGRLARAFPDVDGLGSETHPLFPVGDYVGGCLGGALAFAQGAACEEPSKVMVPLIGDAECETPTTAASWLASARLGRGKVVPIVHLNGFGMGNRSLLDGMEDEQLRSYAAAHGWRSQVVRVANSAPDEHAEFHEVLSQAVREAGTGDPTVIFLRCVKGWSGPTTVGDRRVLGTPDTHKTPLTDVHDPAQVRTLERWLASYQVGELFDAQGNPSGALRDALRVARWDGLLPNRKQHEASTRPKCSPTARYETFAQAVGTVLRDQAGRGDFRVFSPDELASNRLADISGEPWVTEVLGEEVLLGWLAGWTAGGRRGVLISYEAFAPLLTAWMISHLKQRRLAAERSPSLNLLLTSYGWHNVYTHGDPSLSTALLATEDPAVRVLTPADPTRTGAVLRRALDSRGDVNLVIAGKHARTNHPTDTVEEELSRGLAIWPHISDTGEPDLTIVTAGDLPTQVAVEALPAIRQGLGSRTRVRFVNLLDLTVLGDPIRWPRGLSDTELLSFLGAHAAVLVITLGHPSAIWGLLGGRLRRPVEVVGWREPPAPMPQRRLASHLGLDTRGLLHNAVRLLAMKGRP
ncbi:hypothetical protein ACIBFB_06300 [Nocardiopsis sp. NPDC050513]|uniref:phosphoketolase family protein n=1 Tax=Nocardiopsis sp. NPDC050513 TaxID=3364338 RepID=UPI0037A6E15D